MYIVHGTHKTLRNILRGKSFYIYIFVKEYCLTQAIAIFVTELDALWF